MSIHNKNPSEGGQEVRPGGETLASRRRGGKVPVGLGLGLGLLALLPGAASADSYGHAEITLGFPNGAVTVGRTWEDRPREVVVERVTHRLPETDYDEDEAYSEADVIEEDEAPEERIIIEKRRPRVAKKVTIIERYEEPVYYERETVVRKVYVEPPCDRSEVIVHRRAPRHVVYAPSRTVVVQSHPRRVHRVHGHGGGHGHHGYRGGHGGGHGHGGAIKVRGHGPRNLHHEDGGRPMRSRGQRNVVMVGGRGHSH